MESLFEILKTGGQAVTLVILWFMWRRMDEFVTKDGIQLAIKEMEVRLTNWSNERFQTRKVCDDSMHNHWEDLRDLREDLGEHRRRWTDRK